MLAIRPESDLGYPKKTIKRALSTSILIIVGGKISIDKCYNFEIFRRR